MLTSFDIFGIEHLISLIIPIIFLIIFIILAKKHPDKHQTLSILLAILILAIRSVRYAFDYNIGIFQPIDLLSLHVCHINLILLIICLIKPNEKLFIFTFLVGIPTALAVALMPGQIHPAPGMLRAIYFIMSHMFLVIGAIYLLAVYKFRITKKDIKFYYIFSIIAIASVYIYNIVTNSNYMYLTAAHPKTFLEVLYNLFGQYGYIVSLYLILISTFTILYYFYKLIEKQTL